MIANLAVLAHGAESPVSSTWSVEAGSAQLANTYLSPLKYNGWHMGVDYDRAQAMRFCPEKWMNALRFGVEFEKAKNPVGNTNLYSAQVSAGWSMLWRKRFGCGFSVQAGGAADMLAGAMLQLRNGNNPVQARAAVTVGPEVRASWTRGAWAMGVRARTPLLGVFFTPEFGELYYEIQLGDRRGLVHCAHPGSFRRLNAEVFADFRPGATAIRVGYRADLLSAKANGIIDRRLVNAAFVGVNVDWLSLNRKKSDEAKAISVSY